MDKLLQKEKIFYKMNIITNLIKEFSEYNTMEGYQNQKKFTIKIEYDKYSSDANYYYNLKIVRGLNNPKEIFNMRFVYDENINDAIKGIIESLINSRNFVYTSYTNLNNNDIPEKYNITLKNKVVVEIDIKDEEMYRTTKEFEKRFVTKTIIKEDNKVCDVNKDELQKEKAIKLFNVFVNIFKNLESYNSIENYKNKKPYRFKISNYYNEKKECFIYTFMIIRGDNVQEIVLDLRVSIKDNQIIYSLIYGLISEYVSKDVLLYDLVKGSAFADAYLMYLKSNLVLEFEFGNEYDKYFYNEIYKANRGIKKLDESILLKKTYNKKN